MVYDRGYKSQLEEDINLNQKKGIVEKKV